MGKLTSLKRLAIRYNQLTAIPASFSNLILLDELIVESNKLKVLPDGILVALSNLKTINLSRNQLMAFPQGGSKQFESAVSVNMEHNFISLIPFGIFANSTALTKLNFKENQLTTLPLGMLFYSLFFNSCSFRFWQLDFINRTQFLQQWSLRIAVRRRQASQLGSFGVEHKPTT